MASKQLLNTKITSVYKTINRETLEHMTQIRTDEFGVRDSKVQELEQEVQRSKQINSQLMIDNSIMKAKLDGHDKSGCLDYSSQNSSTAQITLAGDQSFDVDSEKIKANSHVYSSKKNSLEKKSYIEQRLNNYLRKKANTHIESDSQTIFTDTDNASEPLTTNPPQKNDNESDGAGVSTQGEFCWRCLRRGHTGTQCRENKTILGRAICGKCNAVGHDEEHCKSE